MKHRRRKKQNHTDKEKKKTKNSNHQHRSSANRDHDLLSLKEKFVKYKGKPVIETSIPLRVAYGLMSYYWWLLGNKDPSNIERLLFPFEEKQSKKEQETLENNSIGNEIHAKNNDNKENTEYVHGYHSIVQHLAPLHSLLFSKKQDVVVSIPYVKILTSTKTTSEEHERTVTEFVTKTTPVFYVETTEEEGWASNTYLYNNQRLKEEFVQTITELFGKRVIKKVGRQIGKTYVYNVLLDETNPFIYLDQDTIEKINLVNSLNAYAYRKRHLETAEKISVELSNGYIMTSKTYNRREKNIYKEHNYYAYDKDVIEWLKEQLEKKTVDTNQHVLVSEIGIPILQVLQETIGNVLFLQANNQQYHPEQRPKTRIRNKNQGTRRNELTLHIVKNKYQDRRNRSVNGTIVTHKIRTLNHIDFSRLLQETGIHDDNNDKKAKTIIATDLADACNTLNTLTTLELQGTLSNTHREKQTGKTSELTSNAENNDSPLYDPLNQSVGVLYHVNTERRHIAGVEILPDKYGYLSIDISPQEMTTNYMNTALLRIAEENGVLDKIIKDVKTSVEEISKLIDHYGENIIIKNSYVNDQIREKIIYRLVDYFLAKITSQGILTYTEQYRWSLNIDLTIFFESTTERLIGKTNTNKNYKEEKNTSTSKREVGENWEKTSESLGEEKISVDEWSVFEKENVAGIITTDQKLVNRYLIETNIERVVRNAKKMAGHLTKELPYHLRQHWGTTGQVKNTKKTGNAYGRGNREKTSVKKIEDFIKNRKKQFENNVLARNNSFLLDTLGMVTTDLRTNIDFVGNAWREAITNYPECIPTIKTRASGTDAGEKQPSQYIETSQITKEYDEHPPVTNISDYMEECITRTILNTVTGENNISPTNDQGTTRTDDTLTRGDKDEKQKHEQSSTLVSPLTNEIIDKTNVFNLLVLLDMTEKYYSILDEKCPLTGKEPLRFYKDYAKQREIRKQIPSPYRHNTGEDFEDDYPVPQEIMKDCEKYSNYREKASQIVEKAKEQEKDAVKSLAKALVTTIKVMLKQQPQAQIDKAVQEIDQKIKRYAETIQQIEREKTKITLGKASKALEICDTFFPQATTYYANTLMPKITSFQKKTPLLNTIATTTDTTVSSKKTKNKEKITGEKQDTHNQKTGTKKHFSPRTSTNKNTQQYLIDNYALEYLEVFSDQITISEKALEMLYNNASTSNNHGNPLIVSPLFSPLKISNKTIQAYSNGTKTPLEHLKNTYKAIATVLSTPLYDNAEYPSMEREKQETYKLKKIFTKDIVETYEDTYFERKLVNSGEELTSHIPPIITSTGYMSVFTNFKDKNKKEQERLKKLVYNLGNAMTASVIQYAMNPLTNYSDRMQPIEGTAIDPLINRSEKRITLPPLSYYLSEETIDLVFLFFPELIKTEGRRLHNKNIPEGETPTHYQDLKTLNAMLKQVTNTYSKHYNYYLKSIAMRLGIKTNTKEWVEVKKMLGEKTTAKTNHNKETHNNEEIKDGKTPNNKKGTREKTTITEKISKKQAINEVVTRIMERASKQEPNLLMKTSVLLSRPEATEYPYADILARIIVNTTHQPFSFEEKIGLVGETIASNGEPIYTVGEIPKNNRDKQEKYKDRYVLDTYAVDYYELMSKQVLFQESVKKRLENTTAKQLFKPITNQ